MSVNMPERRSASSAPRRRAVSALVAMGTCAALASACSSNVAASSSSSQSSSSNRDSLSSQQTKSGGHVAIGFIGFADSVTFTQAVYKQMQAEAAKSNASVTLIDGGLDPKKQATAMQNAIQTGKYTTLVVEPNDAVSLAVQVHAAASAGINVIALDYTFGPLDQQGALKQLTPDVKSTIGLGRDLVTQTFAKNIEASCAAKLGQGKPCKVGLMAGSRKVAFSNQTASSVKTAIDKAGYIQSSFTPDGEFTGPGGYRAAMTFLQNNKNVDVMWAESDLEATGIVQALKQNQLIPGKDVYINSYSGTTEAVAAIKAGTWFSSVPIYPQEGAKAVQDAVAFSQGKSVPTTTSEYDLPGTLPNLTTETLKGTPSFSSAWSATNG